MKFVIKTEADKLDLIAKLTKIKLDQPRKVTIEIVDERTIEQNRQQWPYLVAFSQQKTWEVAGKETSLTDEDWKDILTASYQGEMLRTAPTLDGFRLVALGLRTREFTQEKWPEWMEFLKWAAAELGVKVPVSKKLLKQYGVTE